MIRPRAWLIIAIACCGGGAIAFGAPPKPADTPENVRAAFSGDNAYDTTAFVEQFWRLPGNAGFDASIHRVEAILKEAGYIEQSAAGPDDRLVYRIERRDLPRPTWEPVRASLTIVGDDRPLLDTATNRNLPLINANSTPAGGAEAELLDLGAARDDAFDGVDVAGTIVMAEASPWWLYREAIQKRGAVGMLCYSIPDFNRPAEHPRSIPFGGMPHDPAGKAWGLMLSHGAHETLKRRLEAGRVTVRVEIETKIYESQELTLIAQVRGSVAPVEEFVFSAHVQEPGANDNASGVGCQAEMARVAAELLKAGRVDPGRTITFLWGDEITSTRRYVEETAARGGRIKWGLSLDMVGEDTAKTGGTFLIEKMPDPSAVWPRGEDKFSEWGGEPITLDRMMPHFFNDYIINRCREQAAATGWVVGTNPFEGGSDHVPFLRAGIPGVLLWHFTDVYYHTDGDRIGMVSKATLTNVGVSALVAGLTLASADETVATAIRDEVVAAARRRLAVELELSERAMEAGADRAEQAAILHAWINWYIEAVRSCIEIPRWNSPDDEQAWNIDTHQVATELELELLNIIARLAASQPR